MTKEQKEYVLQIADEIRRTDAGSHFKVFASMTIVRIQDTKNNANYRMTVICKTDTEVSIRIKMLNLFRVMIKEKSR